MNKVFRFCPDATTVYKSINSPLIKKVLLNYVIDGRETNANEWNKEIDSLEELKEFALKNESLLD